MFKTISWPEFISAASWLVGAYYAVSIPWLFHREIIQFLKGRNKASDESDHELISNPENLMGDAKPSEIPKKQTADAEDITISASVSKQSFEEEHEDEILSNRVIADLLGEITILAKVHADSKSLIDEIRSALIDLLSNYSQTNLSERNLIGKHIAAQYASQCSIDLSTQEIKSCWPSSEEN
jgi:hypothetical protein